MINRCCKLPDVYFDDYCFIKIKCLERAYGCNMPFLSFFEYKGLFGYGIICKFYSSVTVFISGDTDEELISFIDFLCAKEILANKPVPNAKKLCTLSLCAKSGFDSGKTDCNINDCKRVYEAFKNNENESVKVGSFEDFYVDISHRIRHGAANILNYDFGAAVVLFDGKNTILNGIVINKDKRGHGYSKKVIDDALGCFLGENLFVACSRDLAPYYLKQNFKKRNDCYLLENGDKDG